MIKVLLEQSCFDKKGFVILGTVVEAILKATGAERVAFGNKLGKFTTTPRPWAKPSASKFHRINGLVIGKDFSVRIVDVSIRERWNVEDEHALLQRVEWGVQRGILKPLDRRRAYLLLQHGEADAVVTLEELNAWGKAVGNYEFEHAQAEGVCAEGEQSTAHGKMEKRVETIVAVAKTMKYDPMNVQWGGKAAIKEKCLKDTKLFTDSTFDAAWKAAAKANRIKVEDSDIYARK